MGSLHAFAKRSYNQQYSLDKTVG